MKKKQMKSYALGELKDKYLGKIGTVERDQYEYQLNMDILGRMIKVARKERKLSQAALGELIGVQRAQISKLESGISSATIATIVKVFDALNARIYFDVVIEDKQLQLDSAYHC